jgi:hypothetical protein
LGPSHYRRPRSNRQMCLRIDRAPHPRRLRGNQEAARAVETANVSDSAGGSPGHSRVQQERLGMLCSVVEQQERAVNESGYTAALHDPGRRFVFARPVGRRPANHPGSRSARARNVMKLRHQFRRESSIKITFDDFQRSERAHLTHHTRDHRSVDASLRPSIRK